MANKKPATKYTLSKGKHKITTTLPSEKVALQAQGYKLETTTKPAEGNTTEPTEGNTTEQHTTALAVSDAAKPASKK